MKLGRAVNKLSFLKLHLLDYLLVITVFLALIVFFNFFHQKEKWVSIRVISENAPFFVADVLSKGDVELGPSGKKTAEITDIGVYHVNNTQPVVLTTPVVNTDKDIIIQVRLLARVNPRTGELEYKNKIIKVGLPIEFRFNVGYLKGTLAEIGEEKREEKVKILTVRLYDQWPWFADSITIGEGEEGQTGQKIIEILSKDVKSSRDPQKVDITLKVKIHVAQLPDELIFRKDERIAIGEHVSFKAGAATVRDALISAIE